MKLTKVFATALLLIFSIGIAVAQQAEVPTVEAALGYSMVRVSTTGFLEKFTTQGGSANIALNLNKTVGVVADFGGYNNNNIRGFDIDNTMFTYLFGPRFSYRAEKVSVFGDALFGGAHISGSATQCFGLTGTCAPGTSISVAESNNSFAMVIGGGFDVGLSKHFAVRPAQFDYLMTRFNPGNSSPTQNNLRYSAMMVFKF